VLDGQITIEIKSMDHEKLSFKEFLLVSVDVLEAKKEEKKGKN